MGKKRKIRKPGKAKIRTTGFRFTDGRFTPIEGIETEGEFVRLDQAVITAVLNVYGRRSRYLVLGGIIVEVDPSLMARRGHIHYTKGMRLSGKLWGLEEDRNEIVLEWNPKCRFQPFSRLQLVPLDLMPSDFEALKKGCMPAIKFYRYCEIIKQFELHDE